MTSCCILPCYLPQETRSKIYHKGVHNQLQTDLCWSHFLFVQTCLPLSQVKRAKWHAVSLHWPNQWSAPAPDYPLTVFWYKKTPQKTNWVKPTDPQPRINTSVPRTSVYSSIDCWSCLRQKNYYSILKYNMVHIKRLNHKSASSSFLVIDYFNPFSSKLVTFWSFVMDLLCPIQMCNVPFGLADWQAKPSF